MSSSNGNKTWRFLSNHTQVLLCIQRDPDVRFRDIAQMVGITERAAQASESTRRALEKLREQERVRIVERSGRLGATFALMPDAPELEAVADAA